LIVLDPLRLASGKSISPSFGQLSLLGHSSQALAYPGMTSLLNRTAYRP
jgi:hypothetical protein